MKGVHRLDVGDERLQERSQFEQGIMARLTLPLVLTVVIQVEEPQQQGRTISFHHLYAIYTVCMFSCLETYIGEGVCYIGPGCAPVTLYLWIANQPHDQHQGNELLELRDSVLLLQSLPYPGAGFHGLRSHVLLCIEVSVLNNVVKHVAVNEEREEIEWSTVTDANRDSWRLNVLWYT